MFTFRPYGARRITKRPRATNIPPLAGLHKQLLDSGSPTVRKARATLIDESVLRRMPLPQPLEGGDKEARGRVLVVGGGRETPGAVLLAGEAALRAGAGKLQVAAGASVAPLVAALIPEARVFALKETKAGRLSKRACASLAEHVAEAQCVCVGPGMIEDDSVAAFVEGTLRLCRDVAVVLDAGAIACLGS